jgi:triosephosphate isomerase
LDIQKEEAYLMSRETNTLLSEKINMAIQAFSLHPVFCIGELLEERNSAIHFEIIENQLTE